MPHMPAAAIFRLELVSQPQICARFGLVAITILQCNCIKRARLFGLIEQMRPDGGIHRPAALGVSRLQAKSDEWRGVSRPVVKFGRAAQANNRAIDLAAHF